MADTFLNIDVDGMAAVSKQLTALSEAIDETAILDEAASLLFNRIRTRFLAQVDSSNTPWVPSKAALKRAKQGRGGGTLFASGALFHSLQVARLGTDGRSIRTDRPYAGYLQFGTKWMPPREFVAAGDDDIAVVQQMIIHRVLQALS